MSGPAADGVEEAEHRGIRWRRPGPGAGGTAPIEFLDPNTSRWVRWQPGVDAPPRPPGWEPAPAGTRPVRPGWRTPWRLVPLAVTALVVVVAVIQVVHPSGNNVKKEQVATAALLGKCLAQHGTAEGHPKYSPTPVPCASRAASVKVVAVVPSAPGGAPCPQGTTGFELPYPGVRYLHILCVAPVR